MACSLQALIALALVLLAAPVVRAQTAPAGVVTTLQGSATVLRAATRESLPLRFKDAVFLHDRITTGDDAIARILLGGKAVVTVRERSVLTITETPGLATVDVAIGKAALAVVKERMRKGETIEFRTPNAVAAVRGTVVIAEVDQTSAQVGRGATAFTSTFTVLRGVVEVSQFDPSTRRMLGPAVSLGALQTTRVTGLRGLGVRPPQPVSPDTVRRLSTDYRLKVRESTGAVNASLGKTQLQQIVADPSLLQTPASPLVTRAGGADTDAGGNASSGGSAAPGGNGGGASGGSHGGSTPSGGGGGKATAAAAPPAPAPTPAVVAPAPSPAASPVQKLIRKLKKRGHSN
jgi:uncharacterized membrane protein YgcG